MIGKWNMAAIGIVGTAIAISAGGKYYRTSQLLMPNEYKDIKTIVKRLAKTNDLGERAITFSITPGGYLEWYAKGFNLCEEDKCSFFGSLDPFKKFKGTSAYEINDSIRQAYIFADIEAYVNSSGTIEISRSTFRVLGKRKDFLACTIAHELDHFITNDQFENNLMANKEIKSREEEEEVKQKGKKSIEGVADTEKKEKEEKEEKEELIAKRISRLSEVDADNGSTLMTYRSGYPLETCLNSTEFIYRIAGLGKSTKPKDTHPGYEDRVAAMKSFNKKLLNNPPEKDRKQTKGNWIYQRDLNTLIFTPK